MKFLASLSFSDPAHYLELARTADAYGWDFLGVSDHIFYPDRLTSAYPYSEDGKPAFYDVTPWPDPWVSVGAMASVTERVRFVTTVYLLALRHPLLAAKTVGTAAYLSNERVVLGVGVGWMREEYDAVGAEFPTRGRRTDEAIEILRRVWRGEMVEYRGKYYDFDRLRMNPVPRQPVPIYIGGASDAALRRAARLADGWISSLHGFEELQELLTRLHRYRKEYGRENDPLQTIVGCADVGGVDGYRRLSEAGATAIQTMPWLLYGGDPSSLQDKAEGLKRFAGEVIEKLRR